MGLTQASAMVSNHFVWKNLPISHAVSHCSPLVFHLLQDTSRLLQIIFYNSTRKCQSCALMNTYTCQLAATFCSFNGKPKLNKSHHQSLWVNRACPSGSSPFSLPQYEGLSALPSQWTFSWASISQSKHSSFQFVCLTHLAYKILLLSHLFCLCVLFS